MTSVLLVGYGNMGSAMFGSWQKNHVNGVFDFYVIDKNGPTEGVFFSTLEEFPRDIMPDIIVFAVKPQQLVNVLPAYRQRFGRSPLYISIAAGKPVDFYYEHIGDGIKIIRAMPNTPALVGKAITALCSSPNISEEEKILATKLIQGFGKAVWVAEENMDAVTAISGSGPAYVFLFLDALTKAGINSGLDPQLAEILARETVRGSIHLAAASDESFEKLRQNVTSKGGTTEAALEVLLHENALAELISSAVKAAVERAKNLA